MKVQFLNDHCGTQWGYYDNGKLALQLVATGEDEDSMPGEPIATPTVNIDHRIELDEILVKDDAENEGMVAALIGAGVVQPDFTLVFIGSYRQRCARCRLTKAARIEAFGLKAKR